MEDRYRGTVHQGELPRPVYNHSAMPVENTSFRPNASTDLYDTGVFSIGPRYGSHRRRSSQVYPDMMASGSLPAAPEVPQDPNPYQTGSHKYSDVNRRASSDRRSQYQEPRNGQIMQSQMSSRNRENINEVSPISPPAPGELEKVVRSKDSKRTKKGPVPEQSPLQKLEGKLGDISKEEKRARMIEAESRYEKKAAKKIDRSANEPFQKMAHNAASTGNAYNLSHRQGSTNRAIPESDNQLGARQKYEDRTASGSHWRDIESSDRVQSAVDRAIRSNNNLGNDQRNRQSFSKSTKEFPSDTHDSESTRAIGLGLYDAKRQSVDEELDQSALTAKIQPRDIYRQTYTEARLTGNKQHSQQIDRGEADRSANQRLYYSDDSKRPGARHTVTFSEDSLRDPSIIGSGTKRKSMGAYLGMNRGSQTLYKPQRPLEEWRAASKAVLTTEDFDLVQPDATGNRNVAWWERKDFQRWRSSSQHISARTEDPGDSSRRQTSFNPPLYLRCGPLLRYTGIHKARTDQETWTGSVMIVTDDQKSSYADPPVLRLFSQPMAPFPAPPEEVGSKIGQGLPPDYVDPVEGETKSSRSGKTLYVKPVDALEEYVDLSRIENDDGLFEEFPSSSKALKAKKLRLSVMDGEKANKYRQVRGCRLISERGVTFWRFNIAVELISQQARVAYRINNGPATGFWVPSKGSPMNIMFHSCNGFSASVNSNEFSGPDPLWRDVLNSHQFRPFHVMIGGGDQIYMDSVAQKTLHFKNWIHMKDLVQKQSAPFTREMQEELEDFYLRRYCTWFSSGLFAMANAQIPMINSWDDHDILDGYGSYSHYSMSSPVFLGIGAIAFKFYMLFQHQSLSQETQRIEPSWQIGAAPGPYIQEKSRSICVSLGRPIVFLGIDCRTERMRDEILTLKSYDLIFERLRKEIISGITKHLIVLLGVPIAYPRLNFLENVLSSRAFEPIKALGKAGLMGNFLNKLDGSVEVLDDLDDHWTAKHHKRERNWLIQELQQLALEKSVRVTILGGDVHLAAVGQFYSNKKLGLPKDRDHRYMPNVISSAITNTPPPDMMADIINQRNKVHHLDTETDEDMIPMFLEDVDGTPRKNTHLLPRRNWCAIREYLPGSTPFSSPPSSPTTSEPETRPGLLARTNSLSRQDFRPANLARRLSRGAGPPVSFRGIRNPETVGLERRHSTSDADAVNARESYLSQQSLSPRDSQNYRNVDDSVAAPPPPLQRPVSFLRRPTNLSEKSFRQYNGGDDGTDAKADNGHINLEGGLEVTINAEANKGDPAGITTPYKLLIPALIPFNSRENFGSSVRRRSRMDNLLQGLKGARSIRRTSTAPMLERQNDSWDRQGTDSGGSTPIGNGVAVNGSFTTGQASGERVRQQSGFNHRQIFQGESFRAESNQRVSSYRLSRKLDQNSKQQQQQQNDVRGDYRPGTNVDNTDRGLDVGRNADYSDEDDDDEDYGVGGVGGSGGHAVRKPSYRRNAPAGRADGFRRRDDLSTSQVAAPAGTGAAATTTTTMPTVRAVSNSTSASTGARVAGRITSVGTNDDDYNDSYHDASLGGNKLHDNNVEGDYQHHRRHGRLVNGGEQRGGVRGDGEDNDEGVEEDDFEDGNDDDDDDDDLSFDGRYGETVNHAADGDGGGGGKRKIGSRYLLDAMEDYSRSEEKERPAYGDRFRRWSWKMWK